MDYKIEAEGALATVKVTGDITFAQNSKFREMLRDISTARVVECELDLSDVEMVDSAGLGLLLIAMETGQNSGWRLKVKGAKGHVLNMLKLTKLSELVS